MICFNRLNHISQTITLLIFNCQQIFSIVRVEGNAFPYKPRPTWRHVFCLARSSLTQVSWEHGRIWDRFFKGLIDQYLSLSVVYMVITPDNISDTKVDIVSNYS